VRNLSHFGFAATLLKTNSLSGGELMDIYSFALQMEKDGEEYYRELAKKSKSDGLKEIFMMLANEEVKHFHFIEKMQQKENLPDVVESKVLTEVKNIFTKMRNGKLNFKPGHYIDTTEETSAYRKACKIEEQSKIFYLEKAKESTDQQARLILEKLADEEQKHYRIMENIVEFVSRPEPGNWLEDAEWHHLEEY
jgi:rubrerythrin